MLDKKIIKHLLNHTVICGDCLYQMSLVEAPPLHVGDGLGWGCEAFWLCLNNECPTFVNSFKQIKKNYGKLGGYRCMLLPDESEQSVMMVLGKDAYTGSLITPEMVEETSQDLIERLEQGL